MCMYIVHVHVHTCTFYIYNVYMYMYAVYLHVQYVLYPLYTCTCIIILPAHPGLVSLLFTSSLFSSFEFFIYMYMYTYTGCMTRVIIHVSLHTVEESMVEPATCIRKSSLVLNLNKTKASPWAFLSHKTHFHVSQCVLLPLRNYTALTCTILYTYTYMYTAHTLYMSYMYIMDAVIYFGVFRIFH